MGESVRLRRGTRRVLEEMVQHQWRVCWSTQDMLELCNDSEAAVQQVVEILQSSGAGTAVVAGSPVRLDLSMPLGYDYLFRLADNGQEILRQVLDASRQSEGRRRGRLYRWFKRRTTQPRG